MMHNVLEDPICPRCGYKMDDDSTICVCGFALDSSLSRGSGSSCLQWEHSFHAINLFLIVSNFLFILFGNLNHYGLSRSPSELVMIWLFSGVSFAVYFFVYLWFAREGKFMSPNIVMSAGAVSILFFTIHAFYDRFDSDEVAFALFFMSIVIGVAHAVFLVAALIVRSIQKFFCRIRI